MIVSRFSILFISLIISIVFLFFFFPWTRNFRWDKDCKKKKRRRRRERKKREREKETERKSRKHQRKIFLTHRFSCISFFSLLFSVFSLLCLSLKQNVPLFFLLLFLLWSIGMIWKWICLFDLLKMRID